MNSYALVAYIPDPLRRFLDDLRRELVPGCVPAAHVTVLPPRPLSGTIEEAIETIRTRLPEFSPFEIEAGEVVIFPVSDVVYLSIREGSERLRQMHPAFNAPPLEFKEGFPFHPHITLAQNLTHEQAEELATVAKSRWAHYPYPRVFTVESLAFVQSTDKNLWVDLEHFQLEPTAPVRRRR